MIYFFMHAVSIHDASMARKKSSKKGPKKPREPVDPEKTYFWGGLKGEPLPKGPRIDRDGMIKPTRLSRMPLPSPPSQPAKAPVAEKAWVPRTPPPPMPRTILPGHVRSRGPISRPQRRQSVPKEECPSNSLFADKESTSWWPW